MAGVGVVAIGRNEGERLERCLASIPAGAVRAVVYVDSASTDGSVARAERHGAAVVRLDASLPFTAARARNAGLRRLREETPEVEFVQFVDGDCEIDPHWIEVARRYLSAHPDVAVVCGRRREIHPEASLYNRLADLEWDTPIGDAQACGGDAMMRLAVLEAVDGYDAGLIAGEEPELCLRIRRRGHRVVRLDAEMTRHDAAMDRFGQWWRRQARAGHAYAEGAWLHGSAPERFGLRPLASAFGWGGLLPAVALVLAPATGGASLGLAVGAWGVLGLRIRAQHRGPHGGWWAAACVLGKPAQVQGAALFLWNRVLRGRRTPLMEYKRAEKLEPPSR